MELVNKYWLMISILVTTVIFHGCVHYTTIHGYLTLSLCSR